MNYYFINYNISHLRIFNAMRIAYSLLLEFDRLIKKLTSQNVEKCSHNFDDWSFVINTVLLFCQCAWIWYPIYSIEWHMVIFVVVCDFLLRKLLKKLAIIHIFPQIYIYEPFQWCIVCQWHAYEFFPRGHPRRSRVTLTNPRGGHFLDTLGLECELKI